MAVDVNRRSPLVLLFNWMKNIKPNRHTHTYAPHSQREADEIKKKRKHIPLVAFKVAQTAKHVDTDRVID